MPSRFASMHASGPRSSAGPCGIAMLLGGIVAVLLLGSSPVWAQAQTPQTSPPPAPAPAQEPVLQHRPPATPNNAAPTPPSETIALTVPKGTPLQVVLDKDLRVRRVGEPIHGRIVEPVYAFDKLVIPVGSTLEGHIAKIESVSAWQRTSSALDADFTPTRKIHVEFTEIVLADGKRIPVGTTVTPGSGQVIQFVSASDNQKKGTGQVVSQKAAQARQQAKQAWDNALKQVKAPGKVHRIERYAMAELPIRPQYIDAGTIYFAELDQPLDFGAEPLTPDLASSLTAQPVDGAVVNARLSTPLSSATAHPGDNVQAVVSQPLFDNGRLLVPEGSVLKGSVLQAKPAGLLKHNGQLRIVFHELSLPNGVEQKVEAVLAGVEAGQADKVKLDSEGGAEATTPKTRYLKTAVSVSLAAISANGDPDAKGGDAAGNTSNRVAGGAAGFKLVGIVLGVLVHSRAFGYSMGAYGAGMSVYSNFISRGRDVVFPKDTAMTIGIGARPASPPGDAAAGDTPSAANTPAPPAHQ